MKKRKRYDLAILLICFIFLAGSMIAVGVHMASKHEAKEEPPVSEEVVSYGPFPLVPLAEEPNLFPDELLAMKERNEDVYAWIDIPDTNVHYPILQGGPDDAYYLDHTIDHEAGYPGSIYTERLNQKDFSDYNTVIYGHNMRDGSMFKHLHKFKDEEFFDSHEYITIYTETDMFVYRIYASVVYSDRHILKKYDFEKAEDRMAFVESLDTGESWNQFREDMVLDEESKLVTLATCIGGRPNNRWIVVGELVNK